MCDIYKITPQYTTVAIIHYQQDRTEETMETELDRHCGSQVKGRMCSTQHYRHCVHCQHYYIPPKECHMSIVVACHLTLEG